MPVNFNNLLEQFTRLVLEDRVTDTSQLFKYDKLVLGEGQGQEFDVPQIGFTNFVVYYDWNSKEFTDIEADLIFNVFIFNDKDVNISIIQKFLGNNTITPNISKGYRNIIIENKFSYLKYGRYNKLINVPRFLYLPFELRAIKMALNFLSLDEAIYKMYNEKHKQNHYIFVIKSQDEARVGRNLFGFNFSIITEDAI